MKCSAALTFALALLLFVLSPLPVRAWGPLGHRTIARVALERLEKEHPDAAAKVKAILAGESIEEASIWPDDIRTSKQASRSGRLAATEEGRAFYAAHPDNSMWHFVDLPLDVTSYGADKRFTAEDDVVATLGKCIDVLEGKSAFMSRRDALRWMVHLAGDVHQPLHVAVGYYKFDGSGESHLITDPNEAASHMEGKDNGGNKLLLTKELPLHKYWDENLVAAVAENGDKLAAVLRNKIGELKDSNTGPCRDWPAQWAAASVEASRELYRGFHAGKRFPRTGSYWTLYVSLNPGAKEQWTGTVERRLTLAAKNLADLLGAIQWGQ